MSVKINKSPKQNETGKLIYKASICDGWKTSVGFWQKRKIRFFFPCRWIKICFPLGAMVFCKTMALNNPWGRVQISTLIYLWGAFVLSVKFSYGGGGNVCGVGGRLMFYTLLQLVTELWSLIDAIVSFLLNILSTNGWIFIKFCNFIDIKKI